MSLERGERSSSLLSSGRQEPRKAQRESSRESTKAPFLAKELQEGPELKEAGGQSSLLAKQPRVGQGPREPVQHLQELHLLLLPPPILPPDLTV